MTSTWRIERDRGVWLVRGDARTAALALGGEALRREAAAERVDAWFPAGWGHEDGGQVLTAIGLALEGGVPGDSAPDAEWLKRTLRRALRDGRVTAVRVQVGVGAPAGGVAEEEEPKTAPRPAAREEKTWIEIVLMDDDEPPQPVAFAKYRIELPNGRVEAGILDANGRARVVGIDPGECQVSFPEFDGRDWA
jgi:hypothetical protein